MGPPRVGVHVIVPFVGRKNLVDRQQSYNVLVVRVPGLETGVKHRDRWPEHSFGCWACRARAGRAGQTYPHRHHNNETKWCWKQSPSRELSDRKLRQSGEYQ